MSDRLDVGWASPGPVSAAFMGSGGRIQVLNGPIGSGKTTTVLMKALRLAAQQAPSTRRRARNSQGATVPVRLFKLCVVRDTYRQLWATTIQSWFKRVPREVGDFVGAVGAPATHKVQFQLTDGTIVDFQVDFVAIGEHAAEDVLRGYEPTAFYLNEADLLAKEVLTYARGRAGRFPDMADGGPSWYGVLVDCNAPTFGTWLYEDWFTRGREELAADGVDLFVQPSGLSPAAENLMNLPPGYYADQIKGADVWYVARMIENKPGYSREGKPVYPEFMDHLHVAAGNLELVHGLPLILGLDAGLNPAAAFCQRLADGSWRVVDELVGETGTGPTRFGEALAQRLHERYGKASAIVGWADPSASDGADKRGGEQSWVEIVAAKAAITIRPAPTNRLIPRLEAVRRPLSRLIDGKPGLLLSPRCATLRQGFAAGYRFRKRVGSNETDDVPEKNSYSHVHDALQYALSGGGEDLAIRERADSRRSAVARSTVAESWDPFDPGR
jgi:hypothetical protein